MRPRNAKKTVRRRRVFYIPGFDPIHPRRYRELYRKEGAAQSEISGYALDLRPKEGKGPYGWHVNADIEGQTVTADVEVLVWSDIVRDVMSPSIPATYLHTVRMAWTYISTGTLRRLMRLRKGPVIAALYPVAALIFYLLVAVGMGWLLARLVQAGVGWLPWNSAVLTTLGTLAGICAGFALAVMVLRWFRAMDGRFYTYYLLHNYAFSASLKGENPPQLETRIAAFTDRIAEASRDDVDEILVVGHSSGAHLAVSVLADLIRDGRLPETAPTLSFLSLGEVMPMVSFLPEAHRLRGDLQFLSEQETLTWVDVTAPGDGCAFALCDPVTVSGVATEAKRWPLVLSAAFSQTLTPARWRALRWRFFRLHFQYLCAFDAPGDYDYFRITAGPKTLSERFEGRAPSKSRIDVPVSKYTSVAA